MENMELNTINNEVAEVVESTIVNDGWKFDIKSAGIGIAATLGVKLLYKFAIKPVIRMVKDKRQNVKDKSSDTKETSFDLDDMDLEDVPEI